MIKLSLINILGLKKGFDKTLENIPAVSKDLPSIV